TDNTYDILREYAKKDNRIRLFKNNQNKGLIYSLNRGLDLAKGDLIARIDDDDTMIPWRLERQKLAMKLYPSITIMGTLIIGTEEEIHQKKTLPIIENPDLMQIYSYTSSGLAHPTIIMRRDFLQKHNIRYRSENLYAEDCGLYADVLNAGGKITELKEHLLRYGVKKNVKRPDNYYNTQYNTFKKIQREKFNRLFKVDEALLGHERETPVKCQLWDKMIEANKTKNIVNQQELEKLKEQRCPQNFEQAIWVKHKYWDDFFIFEGTNRLYRHANKDSATVVKNTPQSITIKWDNYGIEEFEKKSPNTYVFIENH
ncbi:MAG: glycosyltransferase family 2 protein, partial [Alphaproteobacteria bacterium]|nr:glycosyltransferase family 2 protein [Alphaproteobacteria bacterium]